MFAVLSLILALASPAGAAPSVRYTVAPVLAERGLTGLAVEIQFAGDADGETRLGLPEQWAGTGELWRHVSDVKVEGAEAVREDGPVSRLITHRPNAPLTVSYRVDSAYAGDPGFDYEKARPLILPRWFFFHGEGVFAAPEGRQDAPAQFAWKGFPTDWKLASDLDHLSGVRPGTVDDVVESVAIGAPDLRILQRDIEGAPLRIATRGTWSFTPEAFTDMVEKIVRVEDELWGDPARPFFVPLAPLGGEGPGHSFHGTGRSDAFSVASTPTFGLADGTRLLAHEYQHTWIPRELGGLFEKDEQLGYWFSEGFTEYYTGFALLRAGLWSLPEYVADLNKTLKRYGLSPARNATAADVLQRHWSDPAVHQLSYDRGHILAQLVAYRVRQATQGRMGLHDVLLLQKSRAQRTAAEGRPVPAPTLFPSLLKESTGLDIGPDLERYVKAGQTVTLPADLFAGCYNATTVTQPEFHRGFDLAATEKAGNVFTGVDPESPAYAAGLRNGMRLIGREAGTLGDSSVEIAYRVKDGDVERVIRYLPQGKGQISFQRLVPVPDMVEAACTKQVAAVPSSEPSRPRARELGVVVGVLPPGQLNAITDVAGVRVGHTTVVRGESVRTGVTAVLPHDGNLFQEKVPAAVFVGNGFGKLMGSTQVQELGEIETPILLTGTLNVPRVADALISWMLALPGNEQVRSVNPIVAETNDGYLNDIRGRHVGEAEVFAALKSASTGAVEEGSVGAGTGTVAFGYKGGIGTASRTVPQEFGGYTVGVLVQSNFGGVLTINGAPVGRELGKFSLSERLAPTASGTDRADGSIIMVVATDAPLDARNLERLAARAMLGLARTGSFASNGSGDYVIAFSTAARIRAADPVRQVSVLGNDAMSPLFLAVVEATEEAIYNSLFRATTVTGHEGHRIEALPIDRTVEILKRSGAISSE